MKRVYIRRKNESNYLSYSDDRDATRYQKEMVLFVLSDNNVSLMRHFGELHTFLDDIGENLYKESQATTAVVQPLCQNIDFGQLRRTVMEWHEDISSRAATRNTLQVNGFLLSWGAFARVFSLSVQTKPETMQRYLEQTADEYAYVRQVSTRQHVVVSDQPLGSYSVTELWQSARIIMGSMYSESYSLAMREYFHALFFRYCDLLTREQAEAPEVIFDNPLFVAIDCHEATVQPVGTAAATAAAEEEATEEEDESGTAGDEGLANDEKIANLTELFNQICLEVSREDENNCVRSYAINNNFLAEGRELFYHQLCRLDVSSMLESFLARQRPEHTLRFASFARRVEYLRDAQHHWSESLCAIAQHKQLNRHLAEKFQTHITEMHLYHGERERYRAYMPGANNEARDVLTHTRPGEITAVNEALRLTIVDLVTHFTGEMNSLLISLADAPRAATTTPRLLLSPLSVPSSTTTATEAVDEEAKCRHTRRKYELECIQLTKLLTKTWLVFTNLQQCEELMEKRIFILEETITMDQLRALFLSPVCSVEHGSKKKARCDTVLLKLMRVYYVLELTQSRECIVRYRSLFLVDAYFIWLSLLVRNRILPLGRLHDHSQGFVQETISLLSL